MNASDASGQDLFLQNKAKLSPCEMEASSEEKTSQADLPGDTLPENLMHEIFSFHSLKQLLCKNAIVNKRWRQISDYCPLWQGIFKKETRYTNSLPYLASKFLRQSLWGAAFAATEAYAQVKHKDYMGVYHFLDIGEDVCKAKNYVFAHKCLEICSGEININTSYLMFHIIKSQVKEANFVENADELINLTKELRRKDNYLGLLSFKKIANECVDFHLYEKAISCTKKAEKFNPRDNKHLNFYKMAARLLKLKEYGWFKECLCRMRGYTQQQFARDHRDQINEMKLEKYKLFRAATQEILPLDLIKYIATLWLTPMNFIVNHGHQKS